MEGRGDEGYFEPQLGVVEAERDLVDSVGVLKEGGGGRGRRGEEDGGEGEVSGPSDLLFEGGVGEG